MAGTLRQFVLFTAPQDIAGFPSSTQCQQVCFIPEALDAESLWESLANPFTKNRLPLPLHASRPWPGCRLLCGSVLKLWGMVALPWVQFGPESQEGDFLRIPKSLSVFWHIFGKGG